MQLQLLTYLKLQASLFIDSDKTSLNYSAFQLLRKAPYWGF